VPEASPPDASESGSEKVQPWFDQVQPILDTILRCLEAVTVLFLALAILGAIGYETCWIFFGDPPVRQARLALAMKGLNENWKVGLILVVPLFYRTIRGFLERLEEFGGAKAPRKPTSTAPEKPNPSPAVKQVGEDSRAGALENAD
jgi:hypothetical protein